MSKQDIESVHDFFQGWMLYWRIVDRDYLGHREIYGRLNEFLREAHPQPFSMLDCGCGDSSYMVKGIAGTAISHYTGFDLSENALALSRKNLEGLGFELDLVVGDYAELIQTLSFRPDVIWIGLSLHHLQRDAKGAFLKTCRDKLADSGHVLFFEPMMKEGESLEQHMERWWETCRKDWSVINDEEKQALKAHVFEADFPESHATYDQLAREAGFQGAQVLMTDAQHLYAMLLCF